MDEFLWLDATQWQAVGTLALVVLTAWYSILTRKTVKTAELAARSAAISAQAAQQSVQLATMPIVRALGAWKVDAQTLGISLVSLTEAPAFKFVAVVQQGREWQFRLDVLDLPAGQDMPEYINNVSDFPDFAIPYQIELTYHDALGRQYRTVTQLPRPGEGSGLSVEQYNKSSGKWEQLI